jgi:hypothetical protein
MVEQGMLTLIASIFPHIFGLFFGGRCRGRLVAGLVLLTGNELRSIEVFLDTLS